MNVQITDPDKYSSVKKIWNYGAKLKRENEYVDGHLSVEYVEEGESYTAAHFGMRSNKSLEEDYGFRFVSHSRNINNNKYYY